LKSHTLENKKLILIFNTDFPRALKSSKFCRDSNSNGIVSYRLQQDSFLFTIDHYSGEIKLKNRPER
jgi:hypothetical protein